MTTEQIRNDEESMEQIRSEADDYGCLVDLFEDAMVAALACGDRWEDALGEALKECGR